MLDRSALTAALPQWLLGVLLLAVAALLALAAHAVAAALLRPALRRSGPFAAALWERTRRPARLAFVIVACSVALALAPFPEPTREAIGQFLRLGFVALVGWAAVVALDIAAGVYLRRYPADAGYPFLARKHLTQVRILQRAATTLIVVVTIAAALMTFDTVRQYGVSLFASAGAAGLVLGLAARPLLTNLIAGVQLAVTQPIRIDDTVTVENETGGIEEITSTYVVVRLWDGRRLIVPLSHFIEKPFQNWTRGGATLLANLVVFVDPAAPVAAIRDKLKEIVAASPLWDGKVCTLQVSECREWTLALTATVSARDGAVAGDLRALIREELVAFLREKHPEALPRNRAEVTLARPRGAAEGEPGRVGFLAPGGSPRSNRRGEAEGRGPEGSRIGPLRGV